MCAIAGILSRNVQGQEVRKMCERMTLRGPDHQDVCEGDGFAFGHCRLSIIDLKSGNQPMTSIDGNVVIVYNGEIYNFKEIKMVLEHEHACQFQTTSDTEVILAGYQTWGIEGILEHLEGMFAFAIYDKAAKAFYLARDRFGEKPCFYQAGNGTFIFASELKAFAPDLKKYTLDKVAFNFFLALSYIPAPYSIYQEIRKLEPGTYLSIDAEGTIEKKAYYELRNHLHDLSDVDFDDAKQRVKELIFDSVEKRMIADVPMGAFLSGGIDSSIVCLVMDKVAKEKFDTFSIGFNEREYDESNAAQIIADAIGSKHHRHYLDFKNVIDNVSDIIAYYDEPFGDSSAIPSYYVAKLARQNVKAVLTGDSADEIFAGYTKYLGRNYAEFYRKLPGAGKWMLKFFVRHCPVNHFTNYPISRLRKLITTSESDDFGIYYNLMCLGFRDASRQELLQHGNYREIVQEIKLRYDECPINDPLTREQYCDLRYVLEGDMFPKVDRACMHNSLENRTPFLSTPLVEYTLSLTPTFRLAGKSKKHILKETFRDMLPDEILNKPKHGFGVPIEYWLRKELKEEMEALIAPDFLREQGIFNAAYVNRLFEEHLANKANWHPQLWNIYVFQKWYLAHQGKD